jgi:hypothetical protein
MAMSIKPITEFLSMFIYNKKLSGKGRGLEFTVYSLWPTALGAG